MVEHEPPQVGPPVAPERPVEVGAVIDDGGGGRVGQPLGALEGPAAADPPQGVGRERGVADERDPPARRGAADVRQVELGQAP